MYVSQRAIKISKFYSFCPTLQTEGGAPCIVPGRVPEPHLTENQEISNTDSIMLLRLGDRIEAFDKGTVTTCVV